MIFLKPFLSGTHYWEIIPDHRTENELKIGVTTNIPNKFEQSFSDTSEVAIFIKERLSAEHRIEKNKNYDVSQIPYTRYPSHI